MGNVQQLATEDQFDEARLAVIRSFDKLRGRFDHATAQKLNSQVLDGHMEQLLPPAEEVSVEKTSHELGKLKTVAPVKPGEVITGHGFVARARKLAEASGQRTLGDDDYNRYKKRENWHLMPAPDSGINIVVFPEAQFDSGGDRDVRYLYRNGAEWRGYYRWLDSEFGDQNFAAVSQVSPKE